MSDAARLRRWRPRLRLGLILCAFGCHGPRILSLYHDEGAPLMECVRCGEVDV